MPIAIVAEIGSARRIVGMEPLFAVGRRIAGGLGLRRKRAADRKTGDANPHVTGLSLAWQSRRGNRARPFAAELHQHRVIGRTSGDRLVFDYMRENVPSLYKSTT